MQIQTKEKHRKTLKSRLPAADTGKGLDFLPRSGSEFSGRGGETEMRDLSSLRSRSVEREARRLLLDHSLCQLTGQSSVH